MTKPLVTVLMPAYNARRYIKQAVESVLGQTFRDFELLVYDDASTDDTREILRGFAGRDDRVRLVEAEKSGYSTLLARGVDEAHGKYIARMDADDVCLPERLALQVARLQAEPGLVAVGGEALQTDGDGWAIKPWGVPLDHEEIDRLHIGGLPGRLVHPATTFRTETLREVGYRPEFEPAEDYDLYLRLAEVGQLANVPEIVLRYRWHLMNVSVTRHAEQWDALVRAYEAARVRRGLEPVRLKPWSPVDLNRRRQSFVRSAAKHGHYATAAKHLLAFAATPSTWGDALDLAYGSLRRAVGFGPRAVRRAGPAADAKGTT
ncbi:MAG: glycosyltransferase [Planctomycetota bacterium]